MALVSRSRRSSSFTLLTSSTDGPFGLEALDLLQRRGDQLVDVLGRAAELDHHGAVALERRRVREADADAVGAAQLLAQDLAQADVQHRRRRRGRGAFRTRRSRDRRRTTARSGWPAPCPSSLLPSRPRPGTARPCRARPKSLLAGRRQRRHPLLEQRRDLVHRERADKEVGEVGGVARSARCRTSASSRDSASARRPASAPCAL